MFLTVPLPGRGRPENMIVNAISSLLASLYTAAYHTAFHAVAIGDALYCFTQVGPRHLRATCAYTFIIDWSFCHSSCLACAHAAAAVCPAVMGPAMNATASDTECTPLEPSRPAHTPRPLKSELFQFCDTRRVSGARQSWRLPCPHTRDDLVPRSCNSTRT